MAQHTQIGAYSYTVNEHGARIEHSRWSPSVLDGEGRCCGRKTHPYKTKYGLRSWPDPHSCCFRCGREYKANGEQRSNYAYLKDAEGNYSRDEPKGLA